MNLNSSRSCTDLRIRMSGLVLGLILIAHLVGDYVIQSSWMANEKTLHWLPAVAHGITYSLAYCFVFFFMPWLYALIALAVIGGTHIVFDHYRFAKHIVFAKNFIGPKRTWPVWSDCKDNSGYPSKTPEYLATWLMIVADNTVHLIINLAIIALLLR